MANSFYNHGTTPITLSGGASALIRAELDAVTAGFDKFPSLAANANKPLVINGAGTAVTVTTGTLALAGNFATTGAFNTTFAQQASVTLTLPSVSGELATTASSYGNIFGLHLVNNATDPTNDIDVSLGAAMSTETVVADSVNLSLSGTLVKRLDATWVTGTNQGGRTSSQAISDTTWHVFLIRVAGVDDIGFDTSATGANLIADHSATRVRRIASILREAGVIVRFRQLADYFLRDAPSSSVNTTNPGTSAVTATLQVPLGIEVESLVCGYINDSTPTVAKYLLFTALSQTDSVPTETLSNVSTDTADTSSSSTSQIATDTSGQIRYRLSTSDADITVKVNTHGWVDTRGRND